MTNMDIKIIVYFENAQLEKKNNSRYVRLTTVYNNWDYNTANTEILDIYSDPVAGTVC
jgi:hypothetical protein